MFLIPPAGRPGPQQLARAQVAAAVRRSLPRWQRAQVQRRHRTTELCAQLQPAAAPAMAAVGPGRPLAPLALTAALLLVQVSGAMPARGS